MHSRESAPPAARTPAPKSEADEVLSDRPTAAPSLPPEEHARNVYAASMHELRLEALAADDLWGDGEERASQVPTLVPPADPDQVVEAAISQSWSIPPGGTPSQSALGFVDGHARESVAPSGGRQVAAPPVAHVPSLDPGASLADMFAVGNFTGAMQEAERRLTLNPDDEVALGYADECRRTLTRMYQARLGSLEQRPAVSIAIDDIRWMSLDHRAGFVLSLLDGQSTLEEVMDISGMPRLDVLRILVELQSRGVVVLGDP